MPGELTQNVSLRSIVTPKKVAMSAHQFSGENTALFKKIDSISYIYISWTVHGMWMIYITFERGGPKFSNTTVRALA